MQRPETPSWVDLISEQFNAAIVLVALLIALSSCTWPSAEDHTFTPADRENLRPYLGDFPSVACTDYGIPIHCALIIEEDS